MAWAVARHYELLDAAVTADPGVRRVERGEGDSVVAAFSRASDAIAAAVEAQRALSAVAWPDATPVRVRMAVHTGEAELRDRGNYFGPAVIRCARLRSLAHGGHGRPGGRSPARGGQVGGSGGAAAEGPVPAGTGVGAMSPGRAGRVRPA